MLFLPVFQSVWSSPETKNGRHPGLLCWCSEVLKSLKSLERASLWQNLLCQGVPVGLGEGTSHLALCRNRNAEMKKWNRNEYGRPLKIPRESDGNALICYSKRHSSKSLFDQSAPPEVYLGSQAASQSAYPPHSSHVSRLLRRAEEALTVKVLSLSEMCLHYAPICILGLISMDPPLCKTTNETWTAGGKCGRAPPRGVKSCTKKTALQLLQLQIAFDACFLIESSSITKWAKSKFFSHSWGGVNVWRCSKL